MLLGTICLLHGSCKKTRCSRGDGKRVHAITAANWEWFNYPEGTRIAYENNLGERDTAVFGAVVFSEVEGSFYDKECVTEYTQQLTQDITWLHGLKGRMRPVQLIGYGYTNNGVSVKYSEGSVSDQLSNDYKDTVTVNGINYRNVYLYNCPVTSCFYKSAKWSKYNFWLEFAYPLPNNSLEIWTRK